MIRVVRRLAAGFVICCFAIPSAYATEPLPLRIDTIDAFEIASSENRFGQLEFLGGLDLVSTNRNFGGLSGVEISDDGKHIHLLSDRGHMITARLVHQDGRLVDLQDAEIAPIRLSTSVGRGEKDFEDLAALGEGQFLVAREARKGSLARLHRRADQSLLVGDNYSLSGLSNLPRNKGVESVTLLPTLSNELSNKALAVAERPARGQDSIDAWIVDLDTGAEAMRVTIASSQDFDITAARFLPDGDLIILERRAGTLFKAATRIRKISQKDFDAGGRLEGEIIFQADLSHQIDNMEGLALNRDARGRTILTLVSDDNFSVLQRTLILQFALIDP